MSNTSNNVGVRRYVEGLGYRNYEPGASYVCSHEGMVVNGVTLHGGDPIPPGIADPIMQIWFDSLYITPTT